MKIKFRINQINYLIKTHILIVLLDEYLQSNSRLFFSIKIFENKKQNDAKQKAASYLIKCRNLNFNRIMYIQYLLSPILIGL